MGYTQLKAHNLWLCQIYKCKTPENTSSLDHFSNCKATRYLKLSEFMILNRVFSLVLAYLISGWLGLQAYYPATHISLLCLPTGIAVAALLIWGNRVWPGIFLGSFLVNLATGSSSLLAIGSTIGPVLTMQWLNRAAFQPAFTRQKDIGLFILYAGLGTKPRRPDATPSVFSIKRYMTLQATVHAWKPICGKHCTHSNSSFITSHK